MKNDSYFGQRLSRRALLGAGLAGIGVNGVMGGVLSGALTGARLAGVPLALGQVAQAMAADAASKDRILVVVELSGGNDGGACQKTRIRAPATVPPIQCSLLANRSEAATTASPST